MERLVLDNSDRNSAKGYRIDIIQVLLSFSIRNLLSNNIQRCTGGRKMRGEEEEKREVGNLFNNSSSFLLSVPSFLVMSSRVADRFRYPESEPNGEIL